MKIKKLILGLIVIMSSSFLTGCGKNSEFEDKVKENLDILQSNITQMHIKVEDLENKVKIIKESVEIPTTARYTEKEVKFDSIRVASNKVKEFQDSVAVGKNGNINVIVDVLNTTEETLSNMICQAYMVYTKNDKVIDRQFIDIRFEALPKSTRRNLVFENIPIKESDIKHELSIELRDSNGNLITNFYKEVFPK